ncbi:MULTISPECIES: hypothetical protein [Arthrobacter]|uniref:Uncharacterized protein n=2 Tax=Arthrobacter TaxID=1663 RepID=A0ABU9KKF4_9MICC|nr:hypothetical protein [Arthrobacter sp. YJM1]MDP5226706.1 hypothetical protein [Arthrobacter sp. YJM1]
MATRSAFDAFWDEWNEDDAEGYPDPLQDLDSLGAWSMRQHMLNIGRDHFLRAYGGSDLWITLTSALVETDGLWTFERIRSHVIGDNPQLVDLFDLHQGPRQAELDLHLEGGGVAGHTTDAKHFLDFTSNLVHAISSASKHVQGYAKSRLPLLIEGASPGSVRVVLKSADAFVPTTQMIGAKPLFEDIRCDTSDSVALREVAYALTGASDADDIGDEALGNALHRLPSSAHRPLKNAIETALTADWEISGTVRQRGIGRRPVSLTKRGANRLKAVLSPARVIEQTEVLEGLFDGYRISESRMWLHHARRASALPILVPTNDLLQNVIRLGRLREAGNDVSVKVIVKITQKFSQSSGKVMSTARELVSIVQAQ